MRMALLTLLSACGSGFSNAQYHTPDAGAEVEPDAATVEHECDTEDDIGWSRTFGTMQCTCLPCAEDDGCVVAWSACHTD